MLLKGRVKTLPFNFGNYNTLQQNLNKIQAIDNKIKTQEQSVRETEIKQKLEQVKLQVDKLKNILENKVAQKIDADNIHLKDRDSYLLDSYTKHLTQLDDNTLNDAALPDVGNYNETKSIENSEKGVASQSGAASFDVKDGGIKTIPQITEKDGLRTIGATKSIDENAFVEGLWDDGKNSGYIENSKNK